MEHVIQCRYIMIVMIIIVMIIIMIIIVIIVIIPTTTLSIAFSTCSLRLALASLHVDSGLLPSGPSPPAWPRTTP